MDASSEHEANKPPFGLHRIPLTSPCSSISSIRKLSTSSALHIAVFPVIIPRKSIKNSRSGPLIKIWMSIILNVTEKCSIFLKERMVLRKRQEISSSVRTTKFLLTMVRSKREGGNSRWAAKSYDIFVSNRQSNVRAQCYNILNVYHFWNRK